jgi:hypothetical protein
LLDVLDLYTNLPTPAEKTFDRALAKVAASVPQKWQGQVTDYDLHFDHPKASAKPALEPTKPDRMKRLERARRMAGAARRRDQYGQFLMHEVNRTGTDLTRVAETMLFNHGLEWFGILYRTRKKRPETRERQLATSEERYVKDGSLPVSAIRYIQDAVRRHFAEMEVRGDLDWVPDLTLDQYEAGPLKPASARVQREERRREFGRKMDAYETARRAAVEQVWNEVQPVLDEAGVPGDRRPVYRGAAATFCSIAVNAEPGSAAESRQLQEYITEPRWMQLGLDTALAQKLAGIVLARFRDLARSFPPNPRPKR